VERNERLEALEFALTNEKKEKEFYQENADRTNDPLGKAMFASIAEEETEHYNRLLELHGKLEERKKWPEEFSAELTSSKVKEILDQAAASVKAELKGNEKDIEAVRIALEFEEKGEKFYADMAVKADNDAERHFFTLLSSMEREHRLSLLDTLEYFEDPKGWLERKGGQILDGA